MKLGEALAHLKKEKSRLARLISLRKENVYVEKGKKTPFDPEELGKDINKKFMISESSKFVFRKPILRQKSTARAPLSRRRSSWLAIFAA